MTNYSPENSSDGLIISWDSDEGRVYRSIAGATAAALCGIALNVDSAQAQSAVVNGPNCEVKYPNGQTFVVQSVPPSHCMTGLVNSDGSYNPGMVAEAQKAYVSYLEAVVAQQAAAQPTPTQIPTPVPEVNQFQPSAEVLAAEAVIAESNQGGGALGGAQQSSNQGQFVQGEASPQAGHAQSAQNNGGSSTESSQGIFEDCQFTWEGLKCAGGSSSGNSKAIPSYNQVTDQQTSAVSDGTAPKLGRVDVIPGEGLANLAYSAADEVYTGLSCLALVGILGGVFIGGRWMVRRSKY